MKIRLLFSAIIILFLSQPASALPIFARRYETSCTTCHAIIPKLNPFGIAFRNNGYRIPSNDAGLVSTPDVSLGSPEWKKVWPKAVWPGAIPGLPPVAFRAVSDLEANPSQPRLNFNFPNFAAMYFAGPAGDSISYFAQIVVTGAGNSIQINRAYAQFRLTPERPGSNWAMLKVGRLDVRSEPFSSTYRKTTSLNFNVSDYRVFDGGFGFEDREPGFELWGAATGPDNRGGLEYAVGVVQGSSAVSTSYTGSQGATPAVNSDGYKDYYWNASYKFGGFGVVGSRKQKDGLETSNTSKETSLTIGTFGYRGTRDTEVAGWEDDDFTRSGAKVDFYYGKLNVYGAAVAGNDVVDAPQPVAVRSSALFGEADYMALPWVMPLVRLEKTNYSDGRRNIVTLVPAVNFAIRANVRLEIEGRFYNRQSSGSSVRTGANQGVARLDFLF